MSPIYELFDKINGVDGTRLREKIRDYLSEALYPREGNEDEKKSCRCYETNIDLERKQCAGSVNTLFESYSSCDRACKKDSRCLTTDDGRTTRFKDTVFGEPLKCKWDNNAACTWDNRRQGPDCINNCVCLIPSGGNTEVCRYPLMYGQPYFLQLVTGRRSLQRWLTGSRRSKNRSGRPRSSSGNYVWTEDGADIDGEKNAGYYTVEPDQYRWFLGSEASDGDRKSVV